MTNICLRNKISPKLPPTSKQVADGGDGSGEEKRWPLEEAAIEPDSSCRNDAEETAEGVADVKEAPAPESEEDPQLGQVPAAEEQKEDNTRQDKNAKPSEVEVDGQPDGDGGCAPKLAPEKKPMSKSIAAFFGVHAHHRHHHHIFHAAVPYVQPAEQPPPLPFPAPRAAKKPAAATTASPAAATETRKV
jgi:hypothetical protein